jgi:2-amino-4-hydroxy-6-hydroxymethyldihydropteridine diphosphokinase
VWRWCAGVDESPSRAFLAVGSNIEPEVNVVAAVDLLAETPGIVLTGISTFYRTPALSHPGSSPGSNAPPASPAPLASPSESTGARRRADPDFLNGALEIRTTLSPHQLLDVLREVEERLGRVRSRDRYAPRTMDVDLVLYTTGQGMEGAVSWSPVRPGGECLHPDLRTRSFVAVPLLELAPDLLLPPDGTPLRIVVEGFPQPIGIPATQLTALLRSRFLHP